MLPMVNARYTVKARHMATNAISLAAVAFTGAHPFGVRTYLPAASWEQTPEQGADRVRSADRGSRRAGRRWRGRQSWQSRCRHCPIASRVGARRVGNTDAGQTVAR